METRFRNYHYPVLTYYSDDYIESVFSTEVTMQKTGYELNFIFNTTLENAKLLEMVQSGEAIIIYDLECSITGYRTCLKTDSLKTKYAIKEELLNGKFTIFPFIVAQKDVIGYKNPKFNEDYGDDSFNIEEGRYLAVGQSTEINIKKKNSDMLKSSSIFTIIPNSQNVNEMQVEPSNKNIIIKLAREDYERCWSMFENPGLKDILNSAIVVPALLWVLNYISPNSEDEDPEAAFGKFGWYISIKEVLEKRFNMTINDISKENSFEIAQKMLKTPINTALANLIVFDDKSLEERNES